jgi:hypothetical protein
MGPIIILVAGRIDCMHQNVNKKRINAKHLIHFITGMTKFTQYSASSTETFISQLGTSFTIFLYTEEMKLDKFNTRF